MATSALDSERLGLMAFLSYPTIPNTKSGLYIDLQRVILLLFSTFLDNRPVF